MVRLDDEITRRSLLIGFPIAALTPGGMAAAQSSSGFSRTGSPRIPGAVTKPPEWLGAEAPFDVTAYFQSPPEDQNAASLYLDAFFEFGPDVAVCFPDGPVRARRERAAAERLKKNTQIAQALERDPNAVPPREMNAFLALFDDGLARLARAQERPRCVFQTGISMDALLPHVQDARYVGRVLLWKARRQVEQGGLAGALQQASRLLRLVRDLRPRAMMITAMVALALERLAIKDLFLPLLASRSLKVEHCASLLVLLREHEAKSIDVYSEVLRGEYLVCRSTLRDMVLHQDQLRRDLTRAGIPVGPSLAASVLAVGWKSASDEGEAAAGLDKVAGLDAEMKGLAPADLARLEGKLTAYYKGLLSLARTPYVERLRRVAEPPPDRDSPDIPTRVTMALIPPKDGIAWGAFVQAGLRNLLGLVAVRRWQLRHNGQMPPSLEVATKDAGLATVPVDPYSGGPIRLAAADGTPVVYCVGEDGKGEQERAEASRPGQRGRVALRWPATN